MTVTAPVGGSGGAAGDLRVQLAVLTDAVCCLGRCRPVPVVVHAAVATSVQVSGSTKCA